MHLSNHASSDESPYNHTYGYLVCRSLQTLYETLLTNPRTNEYYEHRQKRAGEILELKRYFEHASMPSREKRDQAREIILNAALYEFANACTYAQVDGVTNPDNIMREVLGSAGRRRKRIDYYTTTLRFAFNTSPIDLFDRVPFDTPAYA